jgi:hypothetical protein
MKSQDAAAFTATVRQDKLIEMENAIWSLVQRLWGEPRAQKTSLGKLSCGITS